MTTSTRRPPQPSTASVSSRTTQGKVSRKVACTASFTAGRGRGRGRGSQRAKIWSSRLILRTGSNGARATDLSNPDRNGWTRLRWLRRASDVNHCKAGVVGQIEAHLIHDDVLPVGQRYLCADWGENGVSKIADFVSIDHETGAVVGVATIEAVGVARAHLVPVQSSLVFRMLLVEGVVR